MEDSTEEDSTCHHLQGRPCPCAPILFPMKKTRVHWFRRVGNTEHERKRKREESSANKEGGLEGRGEGRWARKGLHFNLHFIYMFFNVHLFILGERQHKQGRGREREKENPKQALHHQCRARCGARTHEPWDYDLGRSQMLNRPSHPRAPFANQSWGSGNISLELSFLPYNKRGLTQDITKVSLTVTTLMTGKPRSQGFQAVWSETRQAS